MKDINIQTIALLLFVAIHIDFSFCQQQQVTVQSKQALQNGIVGQQQTEFTVEQQFKTEIESQLNKWVVEEMSYNQKHSQIQPHESAIFLLQPNVTHLYRIPASLTKTQRVQVSLFQVSTQGQITLPQNPPQQNFIEFWSMDEKGTLQNNEGIVYISRIFQFQFIKTHKYLKFKNRAQTPFLVLLDIESQQILMELVLSDDKFLLTKKKIDTVLEETKNTQINREHIYKWQWGFYEKHQRHQSDILGFTAVQLFIIIGTSIVQMYCIKNIINEELII